MVDFGVTEQGFVLKTLQDHLTEIEQEQRAATALGPSINQQADSVLGQLNGIFADKLAEASEVQQAIYRSLQPAFSSGEALDNLAALSGVFRLPGINRRLGP